jgi:large subunit ribosomal protein L14
VYSYYKKKKKIAVLGDQILVAIKKLDIKKKINKKDIYINLIICQKKLKKRKNGTFIKFDQNKSLLLSKTLKFLGTRVYGPIIKEIRTKDTFSQYKKIISYSKITL